jgi:hypothetical protein
MTRVRDWMSKVVNSGSWRKFDDVHSDQDVHYLCLGAPESEEH